MIGTLLRFISLAAFIANAIGTGEAQTPTRERFGNATAGVSLVRPAGWHTASLQDIQANRERVRLPDRDLQLALAKRATAPLFVFTKHAEPYVGLNPSIQVTLRPLGDLAGSAPVSLLKIAVAQIQKAFPDFEYVTPVRTAQVSALPAAYTKARYTLKNSDGHTFKVLGRLWVVPRGAFMFIIGMSGPQTGPDLSEAEFAEALASIQIEK